MTPPLSNMADSMDALAKRCFQLDANRQMPRQEPILYTPDSGNTTRSFDGAGCFLTSMIALVLIVVFAAIGVDLGWGFVLTICLATLIYKMRWYSVLAHLVATVVTKHEQLGKIQASVKQGVAAYARGEMWAVARVHEYAVEEFRNRVAAHREKTLGDSSEWGRARASLMEAASDAQRSAAYWRARLQQEPSNEFAKSQKDVSDRLDAKLAQAFEKLEARSVALRRFYNECDARLAAMDRHNRDLQEFRRLKQLSGRADMVIATAEGTMDGLAIAFAAEAQAFAGTLRGVARVSITALAGEASMDNIDYFAERIIEDSERDRAAIEDLERRLSP